MLQPLSFMQTYPATLLYANTHIPPLPRNHSSPCVSDVILWDTWALLGFAAGTLLYNYTRCEIQAHSEDL